MSSYHEPAVIQPTNMPSNTLASAETSTADITMQASDAPITISSSASTPDASRASSPPLQIRLMEDLHTDVVQLAERLQEENIQELDLHRIQRDHELGETPLPLSPRTTANTLNAYSDIDAILLRQICKGLLGTI